MDFKKIDNKTKINPLGQELDFGLKDNHKKSKAVLLIHGYSGRTSNWSFVGEKIYQNLKIPVYIPRLPGHGTNLSDFLNSSADQWLRKALDSYLDLKSNYQEIYLAGLSMGGLIAVLLAAEFKVKKLSLIAPAFFTTNKTIVFTPFLKYFIKKIDNDFSFENKEDMSEEEIDYHQNYSQGYYTKELAELYKLMLKARKKVEKIDVPTQLILTEKDEMVDSKKISDFLHKKMGKNLNNIKIYQESPHVITNSIEKERCADDIIGFFKD
jgi:carboxylesterase